MGGAGEGSMGQKMRTWGPHGVLGHNLPILLKYQIILISKLHNMYFS